MILETKLVNESGMDCLEMEYATISKFLGRSYELMYMDAWGFEVADQIRVSMSRFTPEERNMLMMKHKNTIGNRLSAGNIEMEKYLREFHGIEVVPVSTRDKVNVIQDLKEQIDKKVPVAMWFDQHFMAWTKEIRKEGPLRYTGRLMIQGYDDEKQLFFCTDIHGRIENQVMPYETFQEFLDTVEEFKYDTFRVVGEDKIPPVSEFLDHVIKKVQGEYKNHPNMFEQMRKFAEYVESQLDMEREIEVSQGPRTMPNTPTHIMFIRNFVRIARMRNMYALAVEYMGKVHNDKRMIEMSNQFRLFSANWHQIVAILTKAFFRNRYEDIGKKLSGHILSFLDQEEQMLEELKKMRASAELGSDIVSEKNINAAQFSLQGEIGEEGFEHESLDITALFNNTAVALDKENSVRADFDGIGDYYLFSEGQDTELAYGGAIPFVVHFGTGRQDNVICQGQVLNPNMAAYDYVSFMGACDSGPFFGMLEVNYEDGTKEKIVYGFDEWRFPMCEFKEDVNLQCDRVYHGTIHPEERGYMFYKTLPLDKEKAVQSIKLPTCGNMHLFAITFTKRKG